MTSYGKGEMGGPPGYTSYQSGGFAGRDTANEFSRLSQSVGNNIQKITTNVAQIQRMVQQIGTGGDSEELRDRVHQTTHYTNQLAKETNADLKELSSLPQPTNPSELRQRKMQKMRLAEEFSNSLKNFQTIQRTAAEKEKASAQRARANSNMGNNFFDDEDRKSDDQLFSPGFSQTRQVLQMEEDVDLGLLQEREAAIKKLESDIMDVNSIFKDLGMLVHEQGEVLDSIEANVESAHIHVSEGTQQLASARDYQSKARRKKCCILIVVLVILAIIGLIIGITVSQSS